MFSQMSFAANLFAESTKQTMQKTIGLDVKNVFLRFFILVTFLPFFIFQTFFLFLENVGKVQSDKQINKKHFQ